MVSLVDDPALSRLTQSRWYPSPGWECRARDRVYHSSRPLSRRHRRQSRIGPL